MAKNEKPDLPAPSARRSTLHSCLSGLPRSCAWPRPIDPLRAANRIAGEDAVRLQTRLGERRSRGHHLRPARRASAAGSTRRGGPTVIVVVAGFGTQGYATDSLPAGPAPRGALGARLRRRRGRHAAGRAGGAAGGPRRHHPLGGHGGFRRRISRHRRQAGPLRHRRAGASPPAARIADLRPDAAPRPLAARHGRGARCRQRLHLRPVARRDRRAAARSRSGGSTATIPGWHRRSG